MDMKKVDKPGPSEQGLPRDDDVHHYEHLRMYATISERSETIQDVGNGRNKVRPLESRKEDRNVDARKEKDINDRIKALHNHMIRRNRIVIVILLIVILAFVGLFMLLVVLPERDDGEWSNWGPWEGCSINCGVGQMSRNRLCDNPKPSKNGKQCLGNSQEVYICNQGPCP